MRTLKKSLKKKLFMVICFISCLFMGLFYLSYFFFYDEYVVYQYRDLLTNSYYMINEDYNGDLDSVYRILENFDYRYGIKATIIGKGYAIEFSTDKSSSGYNGNFTLPQESSVFSQALFDSMEVGMPNFTKARDRNSGTEFLLLTGKLDNNALVTLRTSLPIIEENSRYAGFFILWAGSFSLIICLLVAYGFSSRITRPLREINNIAKTMTNLDFSHKYLGDAEDEVGQLGKSINILSGHLESTISQLKQSNSLLEKEITKVRRTDEMRQNFIVNVSHELKTPLALVQGYAEGLKVNINSSEEDKNFYCDVILEESARMAKMVHQLLGLAQIETGNLQPEPEFIDLSSMVESIYTKNALLLENKNLKFVNELEPVMIFADLDMLEQVVLNYFTNAINHSPPEGTITMRYELIADKIRLYVANEGNHIPEEELANIWLNFYKVDKARTRAYGGTGIGLSVVKAVMEAHENQYGVHNLENGVEFWADWDLAEGKLLNGPEDESEVPLLKAAVDEFNVIDLDIPDQDQE